MFVSEHPPHLSTVEGRLAYLPCRFRSKSKVQDYSWKINNVEYLNNLPDGFTIKGKHGSSSTLEIAAGKDLNGTTISCVVSVNSKVYESNTTVLTIAGKYHEF